MYYEDESDRLKFDANIILRCFSFRSYIHTLLRNENFPLGSSTECSSTFSAPRKAIFVASLAYTLSMVASSFTTNLYQIHITRGVIVGFAGAIMLTSTLQVSADLVSHPRMRTNVLACLFSGGGIGAIIFSLAGREVINAVDWRWYYRMLAGVGCCLVLMSCFYPKSSTSNKPLPEKPPKSLNIESLSSTPDNEEPNQDGATQFECEDVKTKKTILAQLKEGCLKLVASFRKGTALYRDKNFVFMGLVWNFYGFAMWIPYIFEVGHLS